jgi:endo-1,3(4)-beta-glucanase
MGIQSIGLSALSLSSSTTLTTDSITAFSINVNLSPSSGAPPAITFPLVQGMGFITGIYNTGTDTPLLESNVFFKSILKVNGSPKPGVSKFRIDLNDGTEWILYAYSSTGNAINFSLINPTRIQGTSNFKGFIQIAKSTGSSSEVLYDASCGSYATGVTLSGGVNGATGTYSLSFSKAGPTQSTLLMFALPHHVQSFSPAMASSLTSLQLNTTTKGVATAILSNQWNLVENIPVTMGFSPWSPSNGVLSSYSTTAIVALSKAATVELSQDMDAQSNLNSVYGAGKVTMPLLLI